MKSCVSLHRFRISADPLGGWFKFSELCVIRPGKSSAYVQAQRI